MGRRARTGKTSNRPTAPNVAGVAKRADPQNPRIVDAGGSPANWRRALTALISSKPASLTVVFDKVRPEAGVLEVIQQLDFPIEVKDGPEPPKPRSSTPSDPQLAGISLYCADLDAFARWLNLAAPILRGAIERAGRPVDDTIEAALHDLASLRTIDPMESSHLEPLRKIWRSLGDHPDLEPKLEALVYAANQLERDATYYDSQYLDRFTDLSEGELWWDELRQDVMADPSASGRDVSRALLRIADPSERDPLRRALEAAVPASP